MGKGAAPAKRGTPPPRWMGQVDCAGPGHFPQSPPKDRRRGRGVGPETLGFSGPKLRNSRRGRLSCEEARRGREKGPLADPDGRGENSSESLSKGRGERRSERGQSPLEQRAEGTLPGLELEPQPASLCTS